MSDGITEGIAAREKTSRRGQNRDLIKKLVPIAQDLARRFGKEGVTVTEIEAVAQYRKLIPAGTKLDFLGSVPRMAGLVNSGRMRRSAIRRKHGNLQYVWLASDMQGA